MGGSGEVFSVRLVILHCWGDVFLIVLPTARWTGSFSSRAGGNRHCLGPCVSFRCYSRLCRAFSPAAGHFLTRVCCQCCSEYLGAPLKSFGLLFSGNSFPIATLACCLDLWTWLEETTRYHPLYRSLRSVTASAGAPEGLPHCSCFSGVITVCCLGAKAFKILFMHFVGSF